MTDEKFWAGSLRASGALKDRPPQTRRSVRIGRGELPIGGRAVSSASAPAETATNASSYDLDAPALAAVSTGGAMQDEKLAVSKSPAERPFAPKKADGSEDRFETDRSAKPTSPAEARHKVLASWADGAKRLGDVVKDVATHEPSGAVEGLLRAAAGPLWKARDAIGWATAAYERRQGGTARPAEEDRKASQTPEGGYVNRDQLARDIARARKAPGRLGGAEPSGYDVVKAGIENGLRLDRQKAAGQGGGSAWTPGGGVRSVAGSAAEGARSFLDDALTDENARLLGRLLTQGAAMVGSAASPVLGPVLQPAAVNPPPEAEGVGLAAAAKLKQNLPGAIEGLGALAAGAVDEAVSSPSPLGFGARLAIGPKSAAASEQSRDANRKAIQKSISKSVQNLPSAVAAIPGQVSQWSEGASEDLASYRRLSAAARADRVLTPQEWDLIAYGFKPVAERGIEAGAVGSEVAGAALGGIGLLRSGARLFRAAPDKPGGGGLGRRAETPGERLTRATIARAHNPRAGWFFHQEQYDSIFRRFREKGLIDKEETIISHNVVPPGRSGASLAGQARPRTSVPFDERGFPMFGAEARAKIDFTKEEWESMSYTEIQREASRRLQAQFDRGLVEQDVFDPKALPAIAAGAKTVPGYIWHHDFRTGQMQLVERDLHEKTGHLGYVMSKQGVEWVM